MIARPVHRPPPIPFDTPNSSTNGNQTRSVSWASTLGAGSQAIGISMTPSRLSPVKAPLPACTPQPSSSSSQANTPRRTSHANNNAMTEVCARYVGHGALSVRSSVTGRHYRFQGHGDSLVIDRNDVVLLKRISDLVIR